MVSNSENFPPNDSKGGMPAVVFLFCCCCCCFFFLRFGCAAGVCFVNSSACLLLLLRVGGWFISKPDMPARLRSSCLLLLAVVCFRLEIITNLVITAAAGLKMSKHGTANIWENVEKGWAPNRLSLRLLRVAMTPWIRKFC